MCLSIVGKFGRVEKCFPAILVFANTATKLSDDCIVEPLGLPIILGMIRNFRLRSYPLCDAGGSKLLSDKLKADIRQGTFRNAVRLR